MAKRWARVLGALLVAVLVGLGIRSLLLPAQSACVFLEYGEGASWERAPESPLFESGDLAFAGFEPIQMAGEDLGAWDEVVIVDFQSPADYEAFLGRIAAEESLLRYHLMEVTPGAPELLYFLNLRLRCYRGDESIDPGASAPLEEVVPDARYAERWSELFEGSYRGAVVMLNLIANREDPRGPVDDRESDATTEELHDRYQQKARRTESARESRPWRRFLGKRAIPPGVPDTVPWPVASGDPSPLRRDRNGRAFRSYLTGRDDENQCECRE